jgi:hypothetical protein
MKWPWPTGGGRGGAIVPKMKEITYYKCVSLTLITQDAVHMRRIVISSVTYLAVSYVSLHDTMLYDMLYLLTAVG